MRARVKVFFDGGCRTDVGLLEIAVVVAGRATIVRDAGYGTSSDAEWLALIHALGVAQATGWTDFVLIGDAADVIAKARGSLKCRGSAERHKAAFREQLAGARPPRIRQVKRTQNLAGIALEKARR